MVTRVPTSDTGGGGGGVLTVLWSVLGSGTEATGNSKLTRSRDDWRGLRRCSIRRVGGKGVAGSSKCMCV